MPAYGPGESVTWSGVMTYDDKYAGTLYVTNERVLFEYKRGKLKKKAYVAFEAPLKDVTNVSVEKGPWNWNVLVIAIKDKKHRLMFGGERPEVIMDKISAVLSGHDPS